jgi:hypothetical protein
LVYNNEYMGLSIVALTVVGMQFPLAALRDSNGKPVPMDAFGGRQVVLTFGPNSRNLALEARKTMPRVIAVGVDYALPANAEWQAGIEGAVLLNSKGYAVKHWQLPPAEKLATFLREWTSSSSPSLDSTLPDPRVRLKRIAATKPPDTWFDALRNGLRLAIPRPLAAGAAKGLAVVFLSTTGAMDELYFPRLNKIYEECSAANIDMLGIFSEYDETAQRVSRVAGLMNIAFPCAIDPGNAFADAFRATRTPEAFLLDSDMRLIYTGAVDSSSFESDDNRRYLSDAIKAMAAGKGPSIRKTLPFGTILRRDPGETSSERSRSIGRLPSF